MLHITHTLKDNAGNAITFTNALAITLLTTDAYLVAHTAISYMTAVAHV